MWNLKNNNIEHCIIENSHPYSATVKKCNLLHRRKIFYFNWETNSQQKKADLRSVSAPEETTTTKRAADRSGTAESTARLRIVVNVGYPLETQCSITMMIR